MSAAARPREQEAAGFTLLEMLVVIAVMGLMVGLVVARGPLRSAGLDVRSSAALVAGALRAARSQAIAEDRAVAVTFDPASGTMRVGTGVARPLRATLLAPERPIVFLPDGSSGGGRVALAAGNSRRAVSVDWLTGRVAISDAP